MSWLTAAGGAVLLAGSGLCRPAQAQELIVEKIPLQYVDARYVGMILGAQILPTEADLWMAQLGFRAPGLGAGGGFGGGYGGGSGVLADPAINSILMLPGARFGAGPGLGVYGYPQNNSLLVGPGSLPFGGAARSGSRVLGNPASNTLLRRR